MLLKVFRYDPEKDEEPYYRSYEVEAEPSDRLLDCLNRIRWEQDPTLSFRMSCGHGVCGSDGMRINGVCGLPCQKLVSAFEGGGAHRAPAGLQGDQRPDRRPGPLLRKIPVPQALSDHRDRRRPRRSAASRPRSSAFSRMRSAASSAPAALPRARSTRRRRPGPMWGRLPWSGPSATSSIHGTRGLPRGSPFSTGRKGLWGCRTLWKCTEVCPKQIPVTKEIGQIKRRIYEAKKAGNEPG